MAKCAECGGVILPENQQKCDCIVPTPQSTEATNDDLTNRLRALSRYEHSDLSIGDEAADEIGRLLARLDRIRTVLDDADECHFELLRECDATEQKPSYPARYPMISVKRVRVLLECD